MKVDFEPIGDRRAGYWLRIGLLKFRIKLNGIRARLKVRTRLKRFANRLVKSFHDSEFTHSNVRVSQLCKSVVSYFAEPTIRRSGIKQRLLSLLYCPIQVDCYDANIRSSKTIMIGVVGNNIKGDQISNTIVDLDIWIMQ